MANLIGTAGNDNLVGTNEADQIEALEGDDTINPGLGQNYVNGGQDDDLLIINYSSNSYGGFRGYISPTESDVGGELSVFYARKKDNNLNQVQFQQIERYQITGTQTADFINTGKGDDFLNGYTGNDKLNGAQGNNTLIGGAGNDEMTSFDGNDTLIGGADNDGMTSGAGNDKLNGGPGDDSLNGGEGSNVLNGGAGNDLYEVNTVDDTVTETSTTATEIDTVKSKITFTLGANVENLTFPGLATNDIDGTGNVLNNSLEGNDGKNQLNGLSGDDSIRARGGNDIIRGGDGNDTLSGEYSSDTIRGGYGNDVLIGGWGYDNLGGGNGNDHFVYDTNVVFVAGQPFSLAIDRIIDFAVNTDKIVLDKTTFNALTSIAGDGFNVVGEFAVVGSDAAAASEEALIIYSSETGNLFYNQNGETSGLGSGAQFATLTGLPDISGSDFIIQA